MAGPTTFTPRDVTDEDGLRRRVIFAYDEAGKPVASMLFKGRDELPRYSLLRSSGPVRHLGEPPRFLRVPADRDDLTEAEFAADAYSAWLPEPDGRGIPHFVVDCTPVGVLMLASELSGDPKWAGLADEIRSGVWSEFAIKVTDALVAVSHFVPASRAAIEAVSAKIADHVQSTIDLAAVAIDATFTGIVPPNLAAAGAVVPELSSSLEHWILRDGELRSSGVSDVMRRWQTRVGELHAEDRLGELVGELRAEFERVGAAAREAVVSEMEEKTARAYMRALYDLEQRVENIIGIVGFAPVAEPEPNWVHPGIPSDAPLVVAQALVGDADAYRAVCDAIATMDCHDRFLTESSEQWNRLAKLRPVQRGTEPPLETRELLVVHATHFVPLRGADGVVEIPSSFDTTGSPRASVHFTLNHLVDSHLYGSWDNVDYVVIAPFDAAVAENGDPANLMGVDTFWTRDPGAPVRLPGAIVVSSEPGLTGLISRVGDEVRVKADGFTDQDITTLINAGVIDRSTLDAPVDEFGWVRGTPEEVRDVRLAGAARRLAVQETIQSLGCPLNRGLQWESLLEDRIRPIALHRCLPSGSHGDSPSGLAEKGEIKNADRATLRVVGAAGLCFPLAPQVTRPSPTPDWHALLP